jgi:hypothetical protein
MFGLRLNYFSPQGNIKTVINGPSFNPGRVYGQ